MWCSEMFLTAITTFVVLLCSTCAHEYDLEEGSHYTNTWVVEFHPGVSEDDASAIAQSHGFINYGKIIPNSHFYEFHHPHVSKRSAEHGNDYTELLDNHIHVRSIEQQIGKKRVKRGHTPEPDIKMRDPLWHSSWYLNRGVSSRTKYDMNVIPAWKKGYTGKNVVVTILDDGIERDHPDLERNYDAEASKDINGNDNDPMPRYDITNENRHGTRCAGEVAAVANNTHCSVGVAYDAKIGGIRMLDGSVTDTVEYKSLSHNPQRVDIYSSSWGPDDNGRTVDGPGKLAKQAFVDGVETGRDGKGSIFMWASGNGGSHSDSCACDGYTNSIYTLSVSSATQNNNPPWYLEQCASTLASTYSSGTSGTEKQIVTTDLRKSCTSTHTGTSASAPLAAGLVAVMLEANPKLTWRDVQYVTLASANPEPLLSGGQFKTNGAGRKYSHKFGYGLMDCAKMADMAVDWLPAPPQLIKRLPKVSPDKDLRKTYTATVTVPDCSNNDNGCIRYLEHVQLALTLSSSRRGRLSVTVTSPLGTTSTVLPTRSSDSSSAGFTDWPFMSVHFWGENPAGDWSFEVKNGGQAGKVVNYQLVLYGVAVDPFDKNREEVSEIKCDETCATSNATHLACSGSGAGQCKKCRPDLYRQEDTNLCVETCGDGYYTDEEKDMCRQCYKLCKTCTGGKLDMCTSCDIDMLLDNNGHCVEECPVGFYPDLENQLCKACKENCTSCISLVDCIVCGDAFDVVKGDCKLKCQSREYRDNDGECTSCDDENCAVCTAAESCEACDSSYRLYHDSCLKQCPTSTYEKKTGRDSGQVECKDCHDSCATCNEGNDNNCLSCHDRFQLTSSHSCVANASCPLGQFREFNIGDCEDCHESCSSCNAATDMDCTSCKKGMYLKDGVCVTDCGPGLFNFTDPNDQHTSCQRCHPSCSRCVGPNSGSCIECPETSILAQNGTCQPVCPSKQYLRRPHQFIDSKLSTTTATATATDKPPPCSNCSEGCLTCTGPRSADCTSCEDTKALNAAGECVTRCPDGYFNKSIGMEGMDNQYICHTCNPWCATCNGSTSSHCLSCTFNLLLFKNKCVQKAKCYHDQYYNSTANECLSCHTTCSGCVGPTELECTSCGNDQDLYIPPTERNDDTKHSGQCVLCCKRNQLNPGICCDCRKAGYPRCDEGQDVATTAKSAHRDLPKSHKNLITITIIGVISCVVIYIVVFMALQYRSYGRCAWQTSSSTVLIDGGGIIEYSSLTDKDVDVHFAADDEINSHQYGNGSGIMHYDSD